MLQKWLEISTRICEDFTTEEVEFKQGGLREGVKTAEITCFVSMWVGIPDLIAFVYVTPGN